MEDTLLTDPILMSIDEDEGVVVKSKQFQSEVGGDTYGATPLEDRNGRDCWVRTRLCFCDKNAPTDCRFHSQKEKGWEECPNLAIAKKDKTIKGRWLWAHNPNYGKPLIETELEKVE
jgi:hypothetical protein